MLYFHNLTVTDLARYVHLYTLNWGLENSNVLTCLLIPFLLENTLA